MKERANALKWEIKGNTWKQGKWTKIEEIKEKINETKTGTKGKKTICFALSYLRFIYYLPSAV
jgi:hypothetical protein